MLIKTRLQREVLFRYPGAEAIFGGVLLGVKSPSGLAFYDWDTMSLVRRIEIQPKSVFWSENGELVAITTDDGYFVLTFDPNAFANATGDDISEDGVESAFDVRGFFYMNETYIDKK